MEPPAFSTIALADGQAEAGSAGGAGAGRVAAIKAVEDVGQGLGVDAFAVVFDDQLDGFRFPGDAEFDVRLGGAVLRGRSAADWRGAGSSLRRREWNGAPHST